MEGLLVRLSVLRTSVCSSAANESTLIPQGAHVFLENSLFSLSLFERIPEDGFQSSSTLNDVVHAHSGVASPFSVVHSRSVMSVSDASSRPAKRMIYFPNGFPHSNSIKGFEIV